MHKYSITASTAAATKTYTNRTNKMKCSSIVYSWISWFRPQAIEKFEVHIFYDVKKSIKIITNFFSTFFMSVFSLKEWNLFCQCVSVSKCVSVRSNERRSVRERESEERKVNHKSTKNNNKFQHVRQWNFLFSDATHQSLNHRVFSLILEVSIGLRPECSPETDARPPDTLWIQEIFLQFGWTWARFGNGFSNLGGLRDEKWAQMRPFLLNMHSLASS